MPWWLKPMYNFQTCTPVFFHRFMASNIVTLTMWTDRWSNAHWIIFKMLENVIIRFKTCHGVQAAGFVIKTKGKQIRNSLFSLKL